MRQINVLKATPRLLMACGILLLALNMGSCKKTEVEAKPVLSLTVVNASPGVANAKVHTVYTGFNTQITGINYGASNVYTLPISSGVSINPATDSTQVLYSQTISGSTGDVYSLFLAGANGEDAVLHQDELPVYWSHGGVTDSSLGVRVINLSYNSSPVNVTLSTSPTTNEFSNVAYKSITDFKSYAANAAAPAGYIFRVMDGDGNLLASSSTINRNTVGFKNITLVFKGVIGGSGTTAPGVQVVNNY